MRYTVTAGIPRDTPWVEMTEAQCNWVTNGDPAFKRGGWNRQWYGMRRFFDYLESKAYKIHTRALLFKYCSYATCEICGGACPRTESM